MRPSRMPKNSQQYVEFLQNQKAWSPAKRSEQIRARQEKCISQLRVEYSPESGLQSVKSQHSKGFSSKYKRKARVKSLAKNHTRAIIEKVTKSPVKSQICDQILPDQFHPLPLNQNFQNFGKRKSTKPRPYSSNDGQIHKPGAKNQNVQTQIDGDTKWGVLMGPNSKWLIDASNSSHQNVRFLTY